MTASGYIANTSVHRYKRTKSRLYQFGDNPVPFGMFIRYSAYQLFFLTFLPVFVLVLIGGPVVAYVACALSLYLHRYNGDPERLSRSGAVKAASAGAVMWALWTSFQFTWLPLRWSTALWIVFFVILISWPLVTVGMQHMEARGLGGFLRLMGSEAATYRRFHMTAGQKPRTFTNNHIVTSED